MTMMREKKMMVVICIFIVSLRGHYEYDSTIFNF